MSKTLLSTDRVGIYFDTDEWMIGASLSLNVEEPGVIQGHLLVISFLCLSINIAIVRKEK